MSPLVITLWLLNVVLDTGGQLAFKAAAGDPRAGDGVARWKYMAARPWLWIGVGAYVAEFVVWIAFLQVVELSEGVLLGSVNIIAIMIAGRILFQEKLSPLRVSGILLVFAGVVVVGWGGV
jgi:drug/metabolite transporter (DMT)-like permease